MEVLLATKRSYLAVVPLWSTQYLLDSDIANYWGLPLYRRPLIMMRGSLVEQTRDVGFFSDESEGYTYSGRLMPSQPLIPSTSTLLNTVNWYLGTSFNGILANLYMDGLDKIGAHSDNEAGLDQQRKCVASIAFGATRTFRIRYLNSCPTDLVVNNSVDRRSFDSTMVADIPHYQGMLMVMAGEFQSEFTHEIPGVAVSKVSTPRLSLTFRQHTK